ncbi:unnamed protein product [Prunus brigantina]
MIYGVDEAITRMMLRRLEKSRVKNKLLRGRLLVFGVGPLSVILSLVFIVGVLEGQSRLDKTCMVRSNQGKHGWV